jgi:outer membrane lipoprotein carrier protein
LKATDIILKTTNTTVKNTIKKKYALGFALSLSAFLSFSGYALADTAPAFQVTTQPVANTQQAVEGLQKKLGEIQSFSANFLQLTQDNLGNNLQSVSGFMQVAKPGKLHWQTEGIYEQLVVSDGKSLWIYDADLEQVSIKNMDNRLSETPALLLGGDVSAIDDDFIISKIPSDNSVLYVLQPKDTSQLFDALELRFNTLDKSQPLTEMVIRDASGQITRIQFTQVKNNPELSDDLFEFEIPAGIDVIDGRHGSY